MIDFRLNDGGRYASGRRGQTGDCLIRAIAIAANLDYDHVYRRAAQIYKVAGFAKTGNAKALRRGKSRKSVRAANETQKDILREFGFEKVVLPKTKPTLTEAYRRHGTCIISTTGHVAALADGALQDTLDIRTYRWEGWDGRFEDRQRKAASVWIRQETRHD